MSMSILSEALKKAQRALGHARSAQMAPMSVAVIDGGGHLLVGLREDGAGILGIEIAAGKARAALAFGCSSREIADALAANPLAGPSVLAIGRDRLVLLPGGVPIHDENGRVMGAIGVAGDAPDRDEAAARHGASD